jgi:hypothetical protein
VGEDLETAAAASCARLNPQAGGLGTGTIFTGGSAPILVTKRFVFNRRRSRKGDLKPAQLFTGAFPLCGFEIRPGSRFSADLSRLEAGHKKLVRNAG